MSLCNPWHAINQMLKNAFEVLALSRANEQSRLKREQVPIQLGIWLMCQEHRACYTKDRRSAVSPGACVIREQQQRHQ